MTVPEFKLCWAIAQDKTIDLSAYDDTPLFGCGLPEFTGAMVPAGAVAKLLRWQCQLIFGGWDMAEFQNCRVICLRKGQREIKLAELSEPESILLVQRAIEPVLSR